MIDPHFGKKDYELIRDIKLYADIRIFDVFTDTEAALPQLKRAAMMYEFLILIPISVYTMVR
jgi:hypothetical protein